MGKGEIQCLSETPKKDKKTIQPDFFSKCGLISPIYNLPPSNLLTYKKLSTMCQMVFSHFSSPALAAAPFRHWNLAGSGKPWARKEVRKCILAAFDKVSTP